MKKLKKLIGILLVFLIIIAFVLIYVIKNNKENDLSTDAKAEQIIKNDVYRVESRSDYYCISNCINKYLGYLTIDLEKDFSNIDERGYVNEELESSIEIETEEEKNDLIYSILDTTFIEKNNITTKNMYNFIEKREGYLNFEAEQINKLEGEEVETYCAYGRIYDLTTLETIDYAYYIVSFDRYKVTFMIEPLKDIYNNIDEIELERRVDIIEENGMNDASFENITDSEMALKYFAHYKKNAINNTERQYEYLDMEYRNKRFGSVENYKKYVNQNAEQIKLAQLELYNVDYTNGDYTQYVCIDQNGNYYIFRETAVMQYTLMLDDYTLDLPEFLEKYNSTSEQGKTALNIQKFMKAINAKDYGYAYNCLSNGFKNNYFKTQEQFEEYVKNNFYEYNSFEFVKFEEQSGVYKYKLIIKDANDETKEFTKTFIVKLNEETNFELSFNV